MTWVVVFFMATMLRPHARVSQTPRVAEPLPRRCRVLHTWVWAGRTIRAPMPRHGTAVVGLALVLVAVSTSVADARVAATGRLITDGTVTTLAVANRGDEPIQCLGFGAAEGVNVDSASGPGNTQAIPPRGF